MSKKLTPYQRIVRNAKKGKGVVLSADEVWDLHLDDAIATRAQLDDDGEEPISHRTAMRKGPTP